MPSINVRDIVEATRLTTPNLRLSSVQGLTWAVSADGRHLVYVTSRGDLAQNKVIYRLVHQDLVAVRDFLNSDGEEPPSGDVVVEFSSSESFLFEHAIRQITWFDDNETLAFLGENQDRPTQVFTYHLPSRRLVQITTHDQPVLAFGHDRHHRRTVYVSALPVISYDARAPAFIVDNGSLNMMLFPERSTLKPPRYQFYLQTSVQGVGKAVPTALLSEPFDGWLPSLIRVSPDGRYAIARIAVNDRARLKQWVDDYDAIRENARLREQIERHDPYLTSYTYTGITQFVLIPLDSGSGTPVFDAPDGNAIGGWVVDAAWLSDGQSVILANTMLPLDARDGAEQHRRRRGPAIVEYELRTKQVRRILDLPVGREIKKRRFMNIELTRDDRLIVHWNDGSVSEFERRRHSWVGVERGAAPAEDTDPAGGRVQFSVIQDMNTPPRIVAKDRATGREKVLLDLGAQFRARRLAPVEEFQWTGKDGNVWKSGLMYPPDAKPGTRMPLVIQTYGFDRNRFILDGAHDMSSAYAAQAMAGCGMLVLLLEVSPDGEHTQAGLRRYQAGIEAAIDILDQRGLIERRRVGLIGFSAMGNVVRHMITFSEYDFAAATIADSWSFTLFGYVAYLFGSVFTMETADKVTEAMPWGESLLTWVANDPSLHTDRIQAAVRIENYSISVSPFWDLYALLRRQHKPAEMVVFPNGDHQLRQPIQRQISLEGNVDWFAFWLMDREDPDPAKTGQYSRWKQMQALREGVK